MKKRAKRVLLLLAAFLGLVWLNNTSLFSAGDDRPLLIAHRGLAPDIGYGYYTDSSEAVRVDALGLAASIRRPNAQCRYDGSGDQATCHPGRRRS